MLISHKTVFAFQMGHEVVFLQHLDLSTRKACAIHYSFFEEPNMLSFEKTSFLVIHSLVIFSLFSINLSVINHSWSLPLHKCQSVLQILNEIKTSCMRDHITLWDFFSLVPESGLRALKRRIEQSDLCSLILLSLIFMLNLRFEHSSLFNDLKGLLALP